MKCSTCDRAVPPSGRSTGHCCNHCARGWGHTFWCDKREKEENQKEWTRYMKRHEQQLKEKDA
jgi:hypothetical protein